jgi:hypothetical protein
VPYRSCSQERRSVNMLAFPTVCQEQHVYKPDWMHLHGRVDLEANKIESTPIRFNAFELIRDGASHMVVKKP